MSETKDSDKRKYCSLPSETYLHQVEPKLRHVVTSQKMSLHVGPLPSAEDLEKYASIGENQEVLHLIMKMAKDNNDTQNKTAIRAQWLTFSSELMKTAAGLIFGISCIVAAYLLALANHTYISGVLVSTTLLIGLSVLVMRIHPHTKGTRTTPLPED